MATLREKIHCETKIRALLEESGLPEPDGVEYGHTCIRLFFEEPKVCLIIDIDEPPPGYEEVVEGDEMFDADDEDEPDPGYLGYQQNRPFDWEAN